MQTIERNYRKHPHTARFLQTFHRAAQGLPADVTGDNDYSTPAERELAAAEDLLDLVPSDHVADLRTPGQTTLMTKLINEIAELSPETSAQAATWTDAMTEHGKWTPRSGDKNDPSLWIGRLIAKSNELRAAARATAPAASSVADGRYAVEEGGTLRFFRVKNGRKAGFVFLDIQASDDWHAIRNLTRIREVLAVIAVDPKAAMVRYGQEIGECGRCGRTLTSEYRKLGLGPVCIDK